MAGGHKTMRKAKEKVPEQGEGGRGKKAKRTKIIYLNSKKGS